ncbi:MAG TPA: 16S rRNA (cytosine(1402)-N(4))-methyltransferase RsmH [Candidatus Paceibacterota bacterium]
MTSTSTSTFTSARDSLRSRREEGGPAHERTQEHKAAKHISVMPHEVLRALDVQNDDVVLDATYGQGGHSALLKKEARVKLISIDADPAAGVVVGNFADLHEIATRLGIPQIDKAVFDLGWNRGQLTAGRGFSFMHDEPLNMSYGPGPRSGFTAAEILNTFTEKALADIFFGYGEERYARRIAAAVVARREQQPFATTLELVEVIKDAVPAAYRRGRLHPATRSFQALRIAVNDELKVIESGLAAAWDLLSCGGRIVVISFHSIEDRVVKRLFASLAKKDGQLLYKKPLTPSAAEVKENPASRSAKLRALQKICPEK